MGVESYITDPKNNNKAHIDVSPGEKNGLIVSTRDLKEYTNLTQFFSNSELGIGMNIDASSGVGAVIEEVYDGGDNPYWTGSIENGPNWDLTSITQANTGTQSLQSINSQPGDTIQFLNPSGNITLSAYSSITLFVYVTANWAAGDDISIYGWDTGGAVDVGTRVLLENYFTPASTGNWQKLTIPLLDMALIGLTIDALRVTIEVRSGLGPTFYIDDLQIEGSTVGGGPKIFNIVPLRDQWHHVDEITLTIAAPIATAPNALPVVAGDPTYHPTVSYLDYTKFLGITLASGVIYQRIVDGVIVFSLPTRSIGDLLSIPNTHVKIWGDDTTTFLQCRIVNYAPLVLKGENDDELRVIVTDDMSDLLLFRATVGGRLESRTVATADRSLVENRSLENYPHEHG
jgi:hypothetical protein